MDSLFEIVKGRIELLHDFVDRFKAALVRVENPDQHPVLTKFHKGLLADPSVINDPSYNGLLFNNFKRYKDVKALIVSHIKMEQQRKIST